MHIPSPFIETTSVNSHRWSGHDDSAAVTSASVHVPDTSRQSSQYYERQSDLNQVKRIMGLGHTDLPFAKKIIDCGFSRTTTSREIKANRTIFSARFAPQT
jgi:hypothetical protein